MTSKSADVPPSSFLLRLSCIFVRDWPEIRKSEIPPSEFCPISEDWGKIGIQDLGGMFLIKSYLVLQNSRFTAFTVPELLRENQQRVVKIPPPLPPQKSQNKKESNLKILKKLSLAKSCDLYLFIFFCSFSFSSGFHVVFVIGKNDFENMLSQQHK